MLISFNYFMAKKIMENFSDVKYFIKMYSEEEIKIIKRQYEKKSIGADDSSLKVNPKVLEFLDADRLQTAGLRVDVQVSVRNEKEVIAGIGLHLAQAGKNADLVAFQFGTETPQTPIQFHESLFI